MLGLGLGTSKGGFVDVLAEVTNAKSVLFDGGDDRIQIGDADNLSFGDGSNDSAFSYSLWIKLPSGDTASHPLIVKDGSSAMEYSIFTNSSSQILFRVHDNSLETYRGRSGGTALSADTWHHILCTYDGTGGTDAEDGMKIYLNGVAETLTDQNAGTYVAMHNTSDPLYIGFTDRISDLSAAANIEEVALWDTELSASQVAQIYHGGQANFDLSQNGGGYTSASNLQAWWRMGDGTLDDNNIAGNGLIGDQTNPTLATAITPHLNDDGNFNNNNWSTTVGDTGDWTGHTSSQTSMTLTKNGTDTGDLRLNLQSSLNSGMSSNLEVGVVYKFVYSVSTTSSLPSWQFRLNHGGGTTTRLYEGTDNVIYFRTQSASVYIQVRSNTDGQNFTLSNISLEKVNGNAGVMINMASSAIETDTP